MVYYFWGILKVIYMKKLVVVTGASSGIALFAYNIFLRKS